MSDNIRKNHVKKFRENIPLSISELARKAGLTPQTISKMEKVFRPEKFRIKGG